MDFLLEPVIDIDTELLPSGDTKIKPCCDDGSGCTSGISSGVSVEEA